MLIFLMYVPNVKHSKGRFSLPMVRSKIQEFWREVVETLSNSSEVSLPLCPRMSVLGLTPKDINLSRANRKMDTLSLLQARQTISKCSESIQRPTTKGWLEDIVQVIAMEKIKYSLTGKYAFIANIALHARNVDFLLGLCKGPSIS